MNHAGRYASVRAGRATWTDANTALTKAHEHRRAGDAAEQAMWNAVRPCPRTARTSGPLSGSGANMSQTDPAVVT